MIFDTALAPPSAAAALASLRILRREPGLPTAVRTHARRLASILESLGLETVTPAAAVVPGFIGDPLLAVATAARCLEVGVRVGCFRPPAVPQGRSCLRLTANAGLTDDDFERVGRALAHSLRPS
jgi:8-amino-7-oxononanoate synthase